jgi:hypothetical protein
LIGNILKIIWKIIKIVFVASVIIVVAYWIYDSRDLLKNYPTKIEGASKENVVNAIDEFIDKRTEFVKTSLSKFEKILDNFTEEGFVANSRDYDYGYVLYSELNKKLSTKTNVRIFIKNAPEGVYVTENDQKYFDKKLEEIEKSIDKEINYLKRKYKNGIKGKNLDYSVSSLLKTYKVIRIAKSFVDDNITQKDINEIVTNFKYKTFNETVTTYGTTFKPIPEFWNETKNAEHNLSNVPYYYKSQIFTFSKNQTYHELDKDVQIKINDILDEVLFTWRAGYVYVRLEETGINDYFGYSIFSKINKMYSNAFQTLEEKNITTKNYFPLWRKEEYTSKNGAIFIIREYKKRNNYAQEKNLYYVVEYKISFPFYKKKYFKTYDEAKKFVVLELQGEKKKRFGELKNEISK